MIGNAPSLHISLNHFVLLVFFVDRMIFQNDGSFRHHHPFLPDDCIELFGTHQTAGNGFFANRRAVLHGFFGNLSDFVVANLGKQCGAGIRDRAIRSSIRSLFGLMPATQFSVNLSPPRREGLSIAARYK